MCSYLPHKYSIYYIMYTYMLGVLDHDYNCILFFIVILSGTHGTHVTRHCITISILPDIVVLPQQLYTRIIIVCGIVIMIYYYIIKRFFF